MYEPFIGSIQYFGFNFAPKGWHVCDGSLLPITQYQAMFALLGTYYGGDGRTTFGIPDLRGRTMIGAYIGGTVPAGSTSYAMGNKGGVPTVTIPASALPQHTHTVTGMKIGVNTSSASSSGPANQVPSMAQSSSGDTAIYASTATAGVNLGAPNVTVNTAGGSQPFNVMNPYLVLTCCVAVQGYFPSRN